MKCEGSRLKVSITCVARGRKQDKCLEGLAGATRQGLQKHPKLVKIELGTFKVKREAGSKPSCDERSACKWEKRLRGAKEEPNRSMINISGHNQVPGCQDWERLRQQIHACLKHTSMSLSGLARAG